MFLFIFGCFLVLNVKDWKKHKSGVMLWKWTKLDLNCFVLTSKGKRRELLRFAVCWNSIVLYLPQWGRNARPLSARNHVQGRCQSESGSDRRRIYLFRSVVRHTVLGAFYPGKRHRNGLKFLEKVFYFMHKWMKKKIKRLPNCLFTTIIVIRSIYRCDKRFLL